MSTILRGLVLNRPRHKIAIPSSTRYAAVSRNKFVHHVLARSTDATAAGLTRFSDGRIAIERRESVGLTNGE